MGEELDRSEVEAFLETRRELGPSYDRELVDAFAERIERAVVAERELRAGDVTRADRAAVDAVGRQLTLGIVSLGTGIPITAISAAITGLPGLTVAWLGIAAVNAAHAVAVRGRRPDR